jgi:hypothetical protein
MKASGLGSRSAPPTAPHLRAPYPHRAGLQPPTATQRHRIADWAAEIDALTEKLEMGGALAQYSSEWAGFPPVYQPTNQPAPAVVHRSSPSSSSSVIEGEERHYRASLSNSPARLLGEPLHNPTQPCPITHSLSLQFVLARRA